MSTVPAEAPAPSSSPSRNPWIISPLGDALFLIGTPILCVAAILPMAAVFESEQISWLLLGFFATGHHLPGFMRAYGDPKLFARFRLRFLLGPPIVFAAAYWFGTKSFQGLLLITLTWDVWHSLMQHYGFMRIYDAKVGRHLPQFSRWDLALSLTWFLTIVINSPVYGMSLIKPWIEATGLGIPHAVLSAIRPVTLVTTLAMTLAYVVVTIRSARSGFPVSRPKLTLLAITFAFITYAWWWLDDLFLGYAMWAVYHDVQYFAITWIFNRRLVDTDPDARGFVAHFFKRRGIWLGLYLLIIFLYGGGLAMSERWIEDSRVDLVIGSLIATSTLLHYWFDGFIWKVREPTTQRGLQVGDRQPPAVTTRDSRALRHLTYLVVPILLIGTIESLRGTSGTQTHQALREAFPGRPEATIALGEDLLRAKMPAEAVAPFEEAVRQCRRRKDRESLRDRALLGLAEAYGASGDMRGQTTTLEIYQQDRNDSDPNLARRIVEGWTTLGDWSRVLHRTRTVMNDTELLGARAFAQAQIGDLRGARATYRRILDVAPTHRDAGLNYATLSQQQGEPEEAARALEPIVRHHSDCVREWYVYGWALLACDQRDKAATALRTYLDRSQGRREESAFRDRASRALSEIQCP